MWRLHLWKLRLSVLFPITVSSRRRRHESWKPTPLIWIFLAGKCGAHHVLFGDLLQFSPAVYTSFLKAAYLPKTAAWMPFSPLHPVVIYSQWLPPMCVICWTSQRGMGTPDQWRNRRWWRNAQVWPCPALSMNTAKSYVLQRVSQENCSHYLVKEHLRLQSQNTFGSRKNRNGLTKSSPGQYDQV